MSGFTVRHAVRGDAPALAAIYAHAVTQGLGTFEEAPPGVDEMARRCHEVQARALPWLVASSSDAVLGFAYVAPFRLRAAYRYTVEDSVYVAQDAQRRGVGGALLGRLVEHCERLGLRQMLAVIGDSGNAASRALHAAQGFADVGVLPAVGFKFGRWVDVVMMARALGPDGSPPPAGSGVTLT